MCFSADDSQVYCQTYSMSGSTSCPSGFSSCKSTDTSCHTAGESYAYTSGGSDWCKNSEMCYSSDGATVQCVDYAASCPAGTSVCRSDEPDCHGPGEEFAYTSSSAWCRSSMTCYKDDGTTVLCQDYSNDSSTMGTDTCPAGYSWTMPSTTTPATTACDGDGVCESGESYGSCPADCKSTTTTTTTTSSCGNAICEGGETTSTCVSDCGTTGSTYGWCGDGTCNGETADWKETSTSCSMDCKTTTTSTTTTPTTTSTCDGDGTCEAGETYASCSSDCAAAESTCDYDNVCEAENNEVAGKCSDCGTATTATTPTGTVKTSGDCNIGDTCAPNLWCNNGRQCYYSSGDFTCASWNDSSCPSGTTFCSPNDPNCIEPGGYGPLGGWCKDGMECYTDTQKFCQPYNYSDPVAYSPATTNECPSGTSVCSPNDPGCTGPGEWGPDNGWCVNSMSCYIDNKLFCQPWSYDMGGGTTTCPSGSKLCSDNDPNCIEPGETGPINGWCKESSSCYDTSYTEQTCVPWSNFGDTQCPSTHPKKCSKGDTNCIESGETGSIDGWCMNAMSCYNEAGTEQYCEPWNYSNMPMTAGATASYMTPVDEPECPTTHPKQCRPTDTNCIEIGDTGPSNGWCASGGQQCYTPDGGLLCVEWGESCPSDAGACRPGETNCVEPGEYASYNSTTTYGNSSWCGGSSVQCFSDAQMYCSPVSGNDPQAWEKATCPTDFGRCRPGEDYCLEIGETGNSGSWCASGMMQWNTDGTVTCVSGSLGNLDDGEKDVCVQVITPAYNLQKDKCKNFSDSCIPAGWSVLKSNQMCKDGKVVDLENVEDEQALIQLYDDSLRYLKDLKLRIGDLPSNSHVLTLQDMVDKALQKIVKFKDLTTIKKKREFMNEFNKNDFASVKQKFEDDVKPFVTFKDVKKQAEQLSKDWDIELSRIDPDTEYAQELKAVWLRLTGLLRQAETAQQIEVIRQLNTQLKAAIKDGTDLAGDRHENETTGLLEKSVRGLEADLDDILDFVSANVPEDDYKILFAVEKFANVVDDLVDLYANGAERYEILRFIETATVKRDQLRKWLLPYGLRAEISGDFEDYLNSLVEEKIAQLLPELFKRVEVLVDAAMQEAAIKVAELVEQGFNDSIALAVENITIVSETHRDELIAAKNENLAAINALRLAVEEAKAEIGTFVANRIDEIMQVAAEYTWCGNEHERIQTDINSLGLAVESSELDVSELDNIEAQIHAAAVRNIDECYNEGVTHFREPNYHFGTWYFQYAERSFNSGYIEGYSDADGQRTGEFGAGNNTLRAEALAMAMRMYSVSVSGDGDVWYLPYIEGASNAGVNRDWDWTQPISRLEAAELFVDVMFASSESYASLPVNDTALVNFPDYNLLAGNLKAALFADLGIISGSGVTGNFDPYKYLPRSEFATVVDRQDSTFGLSEESTEGDVTLNTVLNLLLS